jgi:glycosyltransferase involved in cell wall biosynthesis
MFISTKNIVTITEANQQFNKVTKTASKYGDAIIFKHNKPTYVVFDIAKMGNGDKITFIEQTPDAIELINCLDIFTIVSREDPFPLVMLEAALAQKTMIGFDKTGGCSEFIEEDAGIIVPYLNTFSMASSITKLFLNQSFAKQLGQKAKDKVLNKYSFENSVLKIEGLLGSAPKV